MAQEMILDQTGDFRGKVLEFGTVEAKDSKSFGVNFKVEIDGVWDIPMEFDEEAGDWVETGSDEEGWQDNGWSGSGVIAYVRVWIIKKDGEEMNDYGVEQLFSAGWDGDFSKLAEDSGWEPDPISFRAKEGEYKGKKVIDTSNVAGYEDAPSSGMRKIDMSKAKSMQKKYNSKIKNYKSSLAAKEHKAPEDKAPPKKTGRRSPAKASSEEE